MSCVSQEVKDLYHLLEHEFLPLDFASRAQPLLAKISKLGAKLSSASSVPEVQLSQYIPALEKLTALRVLQQVSQVYQTMKTEMLSKMIPFLGFSVIEKLAVDAVKYDFISMKVNHVKGAVHFGNLDVESGGLRDHLAAIVESLNKARSMIYPSVKRQSKLGVNLVNLADNVEKEHRRLIARKSIIEKRKEEHERQMLELEHEEQTKRLKLQKLNEEAELQRLATEYSRREQERIRREIDEREHQEAQALLMETEKRGKKKGKRPAIEADKVTKQALLELALSEQLKERQEMEKKLQRLAKTMDYMERAKREEEAPLIEAAYQQRLVEEQMLHEREQLQADELSRQHHTGDLQEKNRLSRMLENKLIFQNKIVGTREAEFKRLKEERDDRISQLRAERRHEREIKRKLLFYLKSEEERLNRLQEEEEARKREESERRKKEEAERKAKLDEIAERQRQRERELEERERLRREALLRPPEPTAKATEPAPAARPSQPVAAEAAAEAAAAAAAPAPAPTPGRYVPKFRRSAEGGQTAAPPPEPDRWSRQDDRPPLGGDRWRSSSDDRMSFAGGGSRLPSSSSSSWSSSRGRN